MNSRQPPSTRIWVILARQAPLAAVIRRGPNRHVQLLKWDLAADTFEPGQWFKGRIYERRCDVSPDGQLLLYFAATYKEPLRSWTAISKLPWFTALALWPKGDGWNGGGYFTGDREIHLDHFPGDDVPHPDFQTRCRKFPITSNAEWRDEDFTAWCHTRKRDGWVRHHEGVWEEHWVQNHEGVWEEHRKSKVYSWTASVPEVWRKPHPKRPLSLEMSIVGVHQDNGPWYAINYRVIDQSETEVLPLGLTDWVDWDQRGDLLFARTGCLFRQAFTETGPSTAVKLIDLSANKFTPLAAPDWAQTL